MFEGFSCGEKRKAGGERKKDPVLKPAENNRDTPVEQTSSIPLPVNVECAFSNHPVKVNGDESP